MRFPPAAPANRGQPQCGVMLVLEHLNVEECNIVNTVDEEVELVERVGHPNFQCLLDTYHFWRDKIPLEQLERAMPHIRHVHLADVEGRVAPGESGKPDYRGVFAILKKGGYKGLVSVEAPGFGDFAGLGPKVLAFLKRQWSEA